MSPTQVESLLRHAPRPKAPPELKQHLASAIVLARSTAHAPSDPMRAAMPLWRRWMPALSFSVLLFGCLMVLGLQTKSILDLRRQNAAMQATLAEVNRVRQERSNSSANQAPGRETGLNPQQEEELASLRAEVKRLRERAAELSGLQAENQRLRAIHTAATQPSFLPPTEDPFAVAQAKADRVACINNIKQICLAARMWSNDQNTDLLPLDFRLMQKELVTPKILTCRGDTARTAVRDWNDFDGSSVSYVFMSQKPSERLPDTVYVRCPLHHNVGMTDGSAQQLSNDNTFKNTEGRVTIERAARPPQ